MDSDNAVCFLLLGLQLSFCRVICISPNKVVRFDLLMVETHTGFYQNYIFDYHFHYFDKKTMLSNKKSKVMISDKIK